MNIVTYIYEKTRDYHAFIFGLLLITVFGVVGYYAYQRYYVTDVKKKKPFDNVANALNQQPIVKVYYFFVDWCPYCKKTIHDWNSFKSTVSGTIVDGYLVECISVNCTEDNGDNTSSEFTELHGIKMTPAEVTQLINQFQINAYPTVKMVKDDETIDYDAQINYDNLNKFINTVV
jgi:thiol-disulfide isomerase/thioredoxin